ncbi:MAG: putative zinc-binding protein [bacterium]|nr:putative zinc-binding protein [bacterium]
MELNKKRIILACSGASNTGAYSDKTARKMMQDGNAKMLCLARFAVDKSFAEQSKAELGNGARIVVLDGCPINCGEKTLTGNDIKQFEHINITDFGIVKGQTSETEAKINEICEYLK